MNATQICWWGRKAFDPKLEYVQSLRGTLCDSVAMMTTTVDRSRNCLMLLFAVTASMACVAGSGSNLLGINYGTSGNNLPMPSQVVTLIQSTIFTKVKVFDVNPDILHAFANTGIEIVIEIPNGEVGNLINVDQAQQWVAGNVAAYLPATRITVLSVGNEVLMTEDEVLISQLVPVMQNLHTALVSLGLDSQVKISSAHSLSILNNSVPPSAGIFQPGLPSDVLEPMLKFLSQTGAPFMANAYPYFGYLSNPIPEALAYALFTSSKGYTDPQTNLQYSNMFDAMLDALFSAMTVMGYKDVDIVVTETGWPSAGDSNETAASLENAQTYNGNLIKHIQANGGTPLKPNSTVEAYVFALFNEDLKPGPTSERNYGLFFPDMAPVYNAGVSANQTVCTGASTQASHKWCVPRHNSSAEQLQLTINYACGRGDVDCTPIEVNQPCYLPNSIEAHASFAMNSYFQKQGGNTWDCDFNSTGVIVGTDPSYGSCIYLSC
eukprot:c13309_g1_i2 orf=578-2053(-)